MLVAMNFIASLMQFLQKCRATATREPTDPRVYSTVWRAGVPQSLQCLFGIL